MRSENQTRIIQGDSMDENNRNIRVVKTGGRKVTKTTTEYDWSRLEKRTLKEESKLINPWSKALSYKDERHIPFVGFSRSSLFSDQGII